MMKVVKIDKVNLKDFIDVLTTIYNSGVEYVDIIGQSDRRQDTVSVEVRDEYLRKLELTEEILNKLI